MEIELWDNGVKRAEVREKSIVFLGEPDLAPIIEDMAKGINTFETKAGIEFYDGEASLSAQLIQAAALGFEIRSGDKKLKAELPAALDDIETEVSNLTDEFLRQIDRLEEDE